MLTSSAKQKGRKLQQAVRDAFRAADLTLHPDDIKSTTMGSSGVDVQFSPAAKKVFPFDIECKQVERLQVVPTFLEHYGKYETDKSTIKLLVHSKNRTPVLVTLRFEDLMALISGKSRETVQI